MSIHDEISDNEVLRTAAGSLSALPVPGPPDAEAVMARGRTRRHRRRAGIGMAGTAAAAATAIGLASVLAGGPVPAHATGTIRTLGFTLVKNDNGSVTLTLTQHQMFNPDTLQHALAQDGIPALVQIGTWCSSKLAPGSALNKAVSIQLPGGSPVTGAPGQREVPIPPDAVNVIDPAAIPAGAELFFGFQNNDHDIVVNLINIDSYTCVSGIVPWPR